MYYIDIKFDFFDFKLGTITISGYKNLILILFININFGNYLTNFEL